MRKAARKTYFSINFDFFKVIYLYSFIGVVVFLYAGDTGRSGISAPLVKSSSTVLFVNSLMNILTTAPLCYELHEKLLNEEMLKKVLILVTSLSLVSSVTGLFV